MKITHLLALVGLVALAQWFGIFTRFGIDLSTLLPSTPQATAPQPDEGCPEYTEVFIHTLNEIDYQLPPECEMPKEGI